LVLLVSLGLVAWRSEALRSEPALDSLASRETAFLVNNVLFVAFTFTVLLGTMYPLIAEAVRGVKVSVGGPYFNQMSVPIALALVFLTGVGPALPWRRGSPELLRKKFFWPTLVALLGGVAFWVLGVRHALTWLTLALSLFAVGLLLGELWRPVQARRRAHGESWGGALAEVVTKSRRRYGGYVVHLGVIVIAVGIALSSTYRRETELTLAPGAAATFGGYELRLDSLYAGREPHRDFVEAAFSVGSGPSLSSALRPRLNYYPMSQQPIGTPAVRTRPTGDLYLSLMAYAQDGLSATVHVIINPMVVWIWVGGGIAVLGALFAISGSGFVGERGREGEVRAAPDRAAESAVGGMDR
jgi:cytochrome c-type biogenesis protein CcmF